MHAGVAIHQPKSCYAIRGSGKYLDGETTTVCGTGYDEGTFDLRQQSIGTRGEAFLREDFDARVDDVR